MFGNILRVSASNVRKMFLNVIVTLHTCTLLINKKDFKNKAVHAQNYRRCCTDGH